MGETGVEIELESSEESRELELSSEFSRELISSYDLPQDLHLKDAEWNRFEELNDILVTAEMPIAIFSIAGILISGGAPSAFLGAGAANLTGVYGLWNKAKAQRRKNNITSELENWYLFKDNYDLTDLFEESNPLQDLSTGEMLDSYRSVLADLEEVDQEISELTDTDIANEDFMEDYSYGIQAVRIEEDTDFGGYNFEVNVYLEDKKLGVYRGKTENEEIIQDLESEGVAATKGREVLSNYFDLGRPLGIRLTEPEKL